MNAHYVQLAATAENEQRQQMSAAASADASAPSAVANVVRPASQAERSVMHPEWHDPEWRYYHGAWGG